MEEADDWGHAAGRWALGVLQYGWSFVGCPLIALDTIFAGDGFGLFFDIFWWFVWLLSWLAIAGHAALFRQWRRLCLVVAAGTAGFAVAYVMQLFPIEIEFQIMRPFYERQLAHEKYPKTELWVWDGQPGWQEGVEYFKNPGDAPPPSEKDWEGCVITSQKLGGGFYHQLMDCE